MPLNRHVVRVDPQGQSMAVDILDTSGVSVAAYDSPQFGAALRSLPFTITSLTDFYLAGPGAFDVSCKVSGVEVASAGAVKRVQVSDVPVSVVPDWERHLAADPVPSGGSSAVTPIALTLAWDNPDLLTGVAWFTAAVDSRLGYAQYPLIDVSTSEDWNGTGPEFHLCTITGGVATLLDSLVSAQSPLLDSAAVGGVGAAGMAFTGPQGLIDVPAGTVFGVVVDDSAGGATGGTAGRSVLKSLLWVAATPT